MIIVRSPLRITLGGGGTDLPSYYRDHGGFLVAAAIDKYVYITLHKTFQPGYIIKYSELERVERASDIRASDRARRHRAGRHGRPHRDRQYGRHSGRNRAWFVGQFYDRIASRPAHPPAQCHQPAYACRASLPRRDRLASRAGRQAGPVHRRLWRRYLFRIQQRRQRCRSAACAITHEVLDNLEDGLCLFFTGYTRSASAILKDQDDKSKAKDGSVIDNLHYIKDLGQRSHAALLQGDLPRFAELMNEHWQQKKKRSGEMSNSQIDEWYEIAMRNGALGGKLIGAGGGGFLMFYTENKRRLLHAMLEQGLEEVRFRFDFEGSKTMIQ